MVVIGFDDFRKQAMENNKRLYYFQMDHILELVFIVEGIFVRSFVDLKTINNIEQFIQDKIFIGATRLYFRIPGEENTVPRDGMIIDPIDPIEEHTPLETDEEFTDIQKSGIDE